MPEERLRVRHHLRDPSLRDLTVPPDAAVEGAVVAQPHRQDVRGWDGHAVARFTKKESAPLAQDIRFRVKILIGISTYQYISMASSAASLLRLTISSSSMHV